MKVLNFFIGASFFSLGILVGFLLQQAMTQATLIKVASSLENLEVNVDINETQMVDEMKVFFSEEFEKLNTNQTNPFCENNLMDCVLEDTK